MTAAYRILWGSLQKDLTKQEAHCRVSIDGILKLLNSRNMLGKRATEDSTPSYRNVFRDEARVNLAVGGKPATVSGESSWVRWHGAAAKWQA